MKINLSIIPLLLLLACGQKDKYMQLPTSDNSQTSVDWFGMYEGVLPCADCPGIYTSVLLTEQDSFVLRTKYTDKSDSIFEHKGKITWNDEGSSIQLISDEHTILMWFKVGEDKLMLLDQMGNEIESGWPETLLLEKVDQHDNDAAHSH